MELAGGVEGGGLLPLSASSASSSGEVGVVAVDNMVEFNRGGSAGGRGREASRDEAAQMMYCEMEDE